jgi:putative hydrolase of the HAD superfamily
VASARGLIPPGVDALLFDAVGTVIHPDPPAARVYAAVGQRFGSRHPPEVIAVRFLTAFAREEAHDRAAGLRTSEAREVERWRHIVGAVLDDVTDPEACFQELFTHFSRPGAWRCAPDAAAAFAGLARRGYVLGLASNYDRRLRSVAAGMPPLLPLAHLVISSEVGWRKPAPGFFAAAVRVVGCPPGRILFVGDDRANDYDGARAAGLQALLFDPAGRAAAVPHVRRLEDLLLERMKDSEG